MFKDRGYVPGASHPGRIGQGGHDFDDLVAVKTKTSFEKDASKTIISRNFSPNLPNWHLMMKYI